MGLPSYKVARNANNVIKYFVVIAFMAILLVNVLTVDIRVMLDQSTSPLINNESKTLKESFSPAMNKTVLTKMSKWPMTLTRTILTMTAPSAVSHV